MHSDGGNFIPNTSKHGKLIEQYCSYHIWKTVDSGKGMPSFWLKGILICTKNYLFLNFF